MAEFDRQARYFLNSLSRAEQELSTQFSATAVTDNLASVNKFQDTLERLIQARLTLHSALQKVVLHPQNQRELANDLKRERLRVNSLTTALRRGENVSQISDQLDVLARTYVKSANLLGPGSRRFP